MNKDCAIARDLMPQVIDHVASDESKTFVEDHMQTCEPCTQVYTDMQAEIQGAEASGSTGESTSFKAAMSQLKKTLNWKRIRTASIVALITAVVVFLVYTGYYFLFVEYGHPMPNDDYEVHLFQSEDNSVYVIFRLLRRINSNGISSSFDTDSGIAYILGTSVRILTGDKTTPYWNPNYIMRLPVADDGTLMYSDKYPIQEIRQGTENDYIVVYQAGDPIQPLDPAFDEYLQQEELFFTQMDAASEAMEEARQMSFDAQSDFQNFISQWEKEQDAQATESPAP